MNYFRILIWNPKDQEEFLTAYKAILGRTMMIKNPRQDRWTGKFMVGTGMMTKEKEQRFKKMLGSRVDIRDKEPKLWWDVNG